MSTPAEIIAVLETLALAYPEKANDRRTLALYLEHLADIPAHWLAAAARRHIQTSNWFPRIAELRAAAARLAGTGFFESLPERPVDFLAAQAQALEDAFYAGEALDEADWRSLAGQFERCGRPHRAAHALEKLRRLRIQQGVAGEPLSGSELAGGPGRAERPQPIPADPPGAPGSLDQTSNDICAAQT